MEFSENFIACVRPKFIPLGSGFYLNSTRAGFQLQFKSSKSITVTTESEIWYQAASQIPDICEQMLAHESVLVRANGARARVLMEAGAPALAIMEETMTTTILKINATVLSALGAERITRSKPLVRRNTPSRSLSWLKVASNVRLPYSPVPTSVSVAVIPSPLDSTAWAMRVSVDSRHNEVMFESQQRLNKALTMLADEDIHIRDVLSGSAIACL